MNTSLTLRTWLISSLLGSFVGALICFLYLTHSTEHPAPAPLVIKEYRCVECENKTAVCRGLPEPSTMEKSTRVPFIPVIRSVYQDSTTDLPVIETQRLRIRPIRMSDAAAFYRFGKKPEVAATTTWQVHTSIEKTKEIINKYLGVYEDKGLAPFAIALKETDVMIGTASYHEHIPSWKCITVGWSIDSAEWNKGYATEVARALIEFAFLHLDITRIIAYVRNDNGASRRVMEKAGMSYEGILRDAWVIKGELLTMYTYAILKKDIVEELQGSVLFEQI